MGPRNFKLNFRRIVFSDNISNSWLRYLTSYEISIRWLSLDFTDDKSKSVQLMTWCLNHLAITWYNVDPGLCHHTVSLGSSQLIVTAWLHTTHPHRYDITSYDIFFIKTYLYRITHQPQAVLHEALSSHKSKHKTWTNDNNRQYTISKLECKISTISLGW